MADMIYGDSVRHEIRLAMDLLILGIILIEPNDENHQERVVMRSTLTLLEMLHRNIEGQMKRESEGK